MYFTHDQSRLWKYMDPGMYLDDDCHVFRCVFLSRPHYVTYQPLFLQYEWRKSDLWCFKFCTSVFLGIVICWYCGPVEVGSFLPSTVRRSKSRIASKQMAEAMAQYLWHSFLGWCSRWSYKSRFHPTLNTVMNQMWCFVMYMLKAYSSCLFQTDMCCHVVVLLVKYNSIHSDRSMNHCLT